MAADRNTSIRRSQLKPIQYDDLDATNVAVDNYVPSYDEATGKFTWIAVAGGVTNLPDLADVLFDSGTPTDNQVLTYDNASGKWKAKDPQAGLSGDNVDDFTIKFVDNKLKVADRIELNIMLNAFRIAINGSLSQFGMVDGMSDEFEDESGIDTVNSLNEDYDSVNDLYKPTVVAGLELDYMEYATDGAAQAAYVTSGSAGLPTSEYSSDSYTKLLLHCNGIDESTTIPDSGNTNHGNATIVGTAQLDTAQKKFGTASLLLDGDSDCITYADHDDWAFGSGDFTIDLWLYRTTSGSPKSLVSQLQDDSPNNRSWELRFQSDNTLLFNYSTTGANSIGGGVGGSVPVNQWTHIAAVRNGNTIYFYIDGVATGTTLNVTGVTFHNPSERLTIGCRHGWVADDLFFGGWLDEVRISKGIARWTSDFDTATLQCYSEASIKNQGSYSLKAIATITDSLNDTLTKSGLSLDLSDKDELKIDFYASRTGTNIQVQFHDSGGTTSTKDIVISSADTWTEITWDISGISNANKDDIDSIIIKIINADSANTFYVDNFYAPGITNNMTLISNSETAEAQPDTARIVIFEEDVDSITENTDLKLFITKDGGSTYAQVTLVDEGDYQSGKRILTGLADLSVSGIGSGTSMEYKLQTLNNKSCKIHGMGLLWG